MKTLKAHVNSFRFSHLMIHLYRMGLYLFGMTKTKTRSIVHHHPPVSLLLPPPRPLAGLDFKREMMAQIAIAVFRPWER